MQIQFPHEIEFSNKGAHHVSDVAKSIAANEQLLLKVGPILEKCFKGLVVEKIDIRFRSATTNSPLLQQFLTEILFQYQDQIGEGLPKLIEWITGTHLSETSKKVITTIFMTVVAYGIKEACELFWSTKKGEEKAKVTTQIVNNYVININRGSALIGISPDDLDRAVQQSFPKKHKNRLIQSTLDFIELAKREKGASITGAGVSIESETIASAPSAIDLALEEDDELQEAYQQQDIIIHAKDKDHISSGWAGHMPGICDKRIKMKLFPSIEPSHLFDKDKLIADVILVSKRKIDGDYAPYLLHVINVYP